MSDFRHNERAPTDAVLLDIADYVLGPPIDSELAYETARLCLIDTLRLRHGRPVVPGMHQAARTRGAGHGRAQRRPRAGHAYVLAPVQAAFNIGTIIRWLDFNDCWLAAEWGHPSTTWAASWRWPTGCHARRWRKAARRLR